MEKTKWILYWDRLADTYGGDQAGAYLHRLPLGERGHIQIDFVLVENHYPGGGHYEAVFTRPGKKDWESENGSLIGYYQTRREAMVDAARFAVHMGWIRPIPEFLTTVWEIVPPGAFGHGVPEDTWHC